MKCLEIGIWFLAAYNGGPGYLQRKINELARTIFGSCTPFKEETRNYVPKFIATNYIYELLSEHDIACDTIKRNFSEIDTLTILRKPQSLHYQLCYAWMKV